ncbi:uncharacterized protein FFUJ_06466 [Fusarium fujikuroi IMI 58289]|uniref:C2H2-type domain-containing protein n=1 Tax=Gibberella fujikuroi (strain CBS 195.34 / IMI 58289 / NRRL A-6831) TaxID=1279085 RepID=S0EDL7_GIBF5|nr:uncharacterized protein FFUJ_06466 [Fusarium fujikuroi IMI 58289]KLO83764.1 uncharacterized protein LW93_548 [Fusarium fujikuroi]CCT70488.1 uncharacterized protein FFUJ_06466 [Fusarium fujikuroi IMI 58289]SCN83844.1 uncharacterized protein FFM5_03135 [Fusarium fujikuroi]SCO48247.1 uncharacterized protein FFMR_09105 [Fusarium fujikuroi]
MGGEDQPPFQDEIGVPKLAFKGENVEDGLGYLNTLCSLKPGPSSANVEELGEDSSPNSESDESSSITDTCVDDQKSLMVEKIVFIVTQWLRPKLDAWRRNAADNSKTAPKTSEALSGSYLHTETSNTVNCRNEKRKATERDDCETDDEGEGRNRGDQGSSGMSIRGHEKPKYACPYFKYHPAKYRDWRTCPGPGWNDVHRVKEHLYRRHKQPQYRCARCWQPFTDQQGLTHHQRADEPCPLREMGYVEGFDATQERSLKSRKRVNQKLSETEKWRRVFKILFPHVLDDDIPSPFYDYSQTPQKDDACRHSESGSLAQCEQYMLREVPQRLRQALGRELDRDLTIVEDNLRRRAGDCVRTLIEEVFQELRQIRRLSSPDPRLEANNDISALAEGPRLLISELPSGEDANPHFEGQGEAWPTNFDLDFFDPSSIFEELQLSFDNGGLIEDLLRPGEDGANESMKQSDSGYVSNSPG